MSFFFSPIGNSSQIDANGDPLVGGKIASYLAGSTTPTATYTSNTGATAQANPIILNSLGLPASPIWLAEGISYKFVISSAADVVLQTIDNIEGVNDAATSASEWVASGFVPTFLTTATFSVPGDQTDALSVGRRLRTTNTAGTIYSRISASVFGAVTTVTVVNDSGVLDSGLSVVSYGLLSPANVSLPNSVAARDALGVFVAGTAQATTSGTSIDFTGIPAGTKRIAISVSGLSTSGTSEPIIQIGDAGGIEATGYLGAASTITAAPASTSYTTGCGLAAGWSASVVSHGIITLALLNSATNTWVFSGSFGRSDAAATSNSGASKSLSATLDRVRLTTVGGADTFDAGSINILYE